MYSVEQLSQDKLKKILEETYILVEESEELNLREVIEGLKNQLIKLVNVKL